MEYIKQGNETKQKDAVNFRHILKVDMPTAINLKARETQARLATHKKVVLPTKHDIETFLNFINRERRCNYTELLEKYTHSSFKYGIELCAIYLMVFNRRRAGDVQNILIEDYNHCEGIDEKTDKEISITPCAKSTRDWQQNISGS